MGRSEGGGGGAGPCHALRGGGGTASLRVGTQKKRLQIPGSVLSQPSLTARVGSHPPVFEASKNNLLLLLLLPSQP